MIRWPAICIAMLAMGGCVSSGQSDMSALTTLHSQKEAECKLSEFKSAVAKSRCYNEADQFLATAWGGDSDLIYYRMAKRTDIGERLDKKQITRVQANAEDARITSQIAAESDRRVAGRMQVVAQYMSAQNQNDALMSMARSQTRMADALDGSAQPRYINGQRNPFSWASDYARR
jgi:hypothetical protein